MSEQTREAGFVKSMKVIKTDGEIAIGIDEAGRGPLVGNMFVALVALPLDALDYLKKMGVKDSKKLSRNRRTELFGKIVEVSELIIVKAIQPHRIDEANINDLFVSTVVHMLKKAVKALHGSYAIKRVVVDSISSRQKLERAARAALGASDIEVIVEFKADERFVEVSAASIVAKVLRDQHIELLKKVYGDLGSGYPGDPKTRAWLEDFVRRHGFIPPIVRKKWSTLKSISNLDLKTSTQKKLTDFIRGE